MTNIASALSAARDKIDRLDAEVLLAHVLDKERSYLRAWPERELDDDALSRFQQLLRRRQQGEPLAYLTGWREFWSLLLQVTPATLIPRPETELLVEQALEKIPANANWHIADLGTGSGAIALAIASERATCQIIATDICAEALKVAQTNAQRLQLHNIEFRQGEWRDALKQNEHFELIVSNPPYIDVEDEHLQGDGLPFEPQTALTPGKDGLLAIHIIVEQMKAHLSPLGWLLLEHAYHQAAEVRELLEQHNYKEISTLRDLSGNDRLTQAVAPT